MSPFAIVVSWTDLNFQKTALIVFAYAAHKTYRRIVRRLTLKAFDTVLLTYDTDGIIHSF
jgi:hypothetical protein